MDPADPAAGQLVQLPVHPPERVPPALLPAPDQGLRAADDRRAQNLRRRAASGGRRGAQLGQEVAHGSRRQGRVEEGEIGQNGQSSWIAHQEEGQYGEKGSVNNSYVNSYSSHRNCSTPLP